MSQPSQTMQPGANLVLSSMYGTVTVMHEISKEVDTSLTAFLLTDGGKVQGDNGIVFYNQPQGPGGCATYIPPRDEAGEKVHKIHFDLGKLPPGISKIAISLTEDQNVGFIKVKNLKARVEIGTEVIELMPGQFSSEKGIVVLELYVRNNQPKVKSVWQGFSSGLDGLCNHFGVEVADTPPPIVEEPPKKVNLQKVTGKVSLSKGQKPIIIDKTKEIIASVTWDSRTDYDIYALVYTKDGQQVDVAMFGAKGVRPLKNYGNGIVEHMGDVRRSNKKSKSAINTEVIKIRPDDKVLAVVPVVYSAQSNGTGSFYRYRVAMAIDNNQGTTVTITSENANNNDRIYTCVPGIILNTADGIVIDPVEKYSKPNSENRPKLQVDKTGKLEVVMDAGPKNDYK